MDSRCPTRFAARDSFRNSPPTEETNERIVEHYADRFKDLILRHARSEDVYDLLRFSAF